MNEKKSKHPVLKAFLIIFVVLAVAVAGPFATFSVTKNIYQKEIDKLRTQIENAPDNEDVEVDTDILKTELKRISELATAEMTYACKSNVKKGSVPFVTETGCVMYYEATVKAGIDVDKIKISNEEKKVVVTLPAARVLGDPDIKDESIQYYDEKKAVFNWKDGKYYDEARTQAKADVLRHKTTKQLLKFADDYAEEIAKDLLSGLTGNKKLVIKHTKRTAESEGALKAIIPFSSTDVKGKDYKDLKNQLEKAGFTNVIPKGLEDINAISGIVLKENTVKEITIEGKSIFEKDQVVESDALVIIWYHSK